MFIQTCWFPKFELYPILSKRKWVKKMKWYPSLLARLLGIILTSLKLMLIAWGFLPSSIDRVGTDLVTKHIIACSRQALMFMQFRPSYKIGWCSCNLIQQASHVAMNLNKILGANLVAEIVNFRLAKMMFMQHHPSFKIGYNSNFELN